MLGQTLKVRKGLILRLYDQAGNFGEGEISPMPLMHVESLSQAETQLKKFLSKYKLTWITMAMKTINHIS